MLDLTRQQLAIVRELIARHLPNREVRAFGSRVNGRAWRYSDLDLAVMGGEPLPNLVLATLRADFEDSDLPFRVDLLESRDLPAAWITSFNDQSERIYPPLFAADRGTDGTPHAELASES
ncbi:nucleotidyltransferase family protein [uncultured Thiodictyon sp.]|uniref:nucleotidyltransferase family protein n=1 Tax=uncultured Thiodictyon sp. TaxID=1846217 RepID=UPI0025FB16EF|nr:nucleotidyltransferase domain-containing protein [uncultured Thiodictyon sp.]